MTVALPVLVPMATLTVLPICVVPVIVGVKLPTIALFAGEVIANVWMTIGCPAVPDRVRGGGLVALAS